ncbi:hypothetical protein Drose_06310 [Dactylosporangium roseum]|uniref:Uncharacterized protein n=1 Tax=Dactylosporangium roseum TaxID=47989 RepID=A0ABY5Z751_9ACTN|nr:hypothetical protein [Dactylosporangium roseum]UWZ37885.1 hypothetical protein Drose_06310 [Dactylosporangium roseum]
MTPRAAAAERTARRWLVAFAVGFALWVAARTASSAATDERLLVAVGLVRGPLFAAWLLALIQAARLRGWAAGHEAAQPRPIPREEIKP